MCAGLLLVLTCLLLENFWTCALLEQVLSCKTKKARALDNTTNRNTAEQAASLCLPSSVTYFTSCWEDDISYILLTAEDRFTSTPAAKLHTSTSSMCNTANSAFKAWKPLATITPFLLLTSWLWEKYVSICWSEPWKLYQNQLRASLSLLHQLFCHSSLISYFSN